MADNSTLPATGDVVAADEIGGVKYQRVKVSVGADGSAADMTAGAGSVAASTPRVTLAADDPAVAAIADVEAAVTNSALPVGAGTAAAAGRVTHASDDPVTVALQIMDDWDETNRAAVNTIAGQVGVAAGAGSVSALTQRVTLASDDPGVASLSVLDDWDETNRAAVNTIAGQVGVAAGSGANSALTQRVTVATDDAMMASIRSPGLSAAATFTPAAASHVANDCNGAAGTFSLGAVSAGRVMITDATLEIDGATAEATAWRLYLYNVTPPSATADDGAWDLPSGDRASFLGYVDLGTAVDLGSTQWVEVRGINKMIKLSGTGVFGYLVNLTTLTPAAVAHIVTIYATQL